MNESSHLLVFIMDDRRYALKLSAVERAVPMVDVTPLPKGPEIVLGVIAYRGKVIPVLNIRRRFGMPERKVGLNDHIIIAHTARRTVAIIVDRVTDVVDIQDRAVIEPHEILPSMEHVEGVVKLEDGMLLIHDLDRFLSLEEEQALEAAMEMGRRYDPPGPASHTDQT